MKKKIIKILIPTLIILLFASCSSKAPELKNSIKNNKIPFMEISHIFNEDVSTSGFINTDMIKPLKEIKKIKINNKIYKLKPAYSVFKESTLASQAHKEISSKKTYNKTKIENNKYQVTFNNNNSVDILNKKQQEYIIKNFTFKKRDIAGVISQYLFEDKNIKFYPLSLNKDTLSVITSKNKIITLDLITQKFESKDSNIQDFHPTAKTITKNHILHKNKIYKFDKKHTSFYPIKTLSFSPSEIENPNKKFLQAKYNKQAYYINKNKIFTIKTSKKISFANKITKNKSYLVVYQNDKIHIYSHKTKKWKQITRYTNDLRIKNNYGFFRIKNLSKAVELETTSEINGIGEIFDLNNKLFHPYSIIKTNSQLFDYLNTLKNKNKNIDTQRILRYFTKDYTFSLVKNIKNKNKNLSLVNLKMPNIKNFATFLIDTKGKLSKINTANTLTINNYTLLQSLKDTNKKEYDIIPYVNGYHLFNGSLTPATTQLTKNESATKDYIKERISANGNNQYLYTTHKYDTAFFFPFLAVGSLSPNSATPPKPKTKTLSPKETLTLLLVKHTLNKAFTEDKNKDTDTLYYYNLHICQNKPSDCIKIDTIPLSKKETKEIPKNIIVALKLHDLQKDYKIDLNYEVYNLKNKLIYYRLNSIPMVFSQGDIQE